MLTLQAFNIENLCLLILEICFVLLPDMKALAMIILITYFQ